MTVFWRRSPQCDEICVLLQILRIHISSEEDSFFLHSLEVSEEDFQSLKVDQGILVDFSNFPNKVITLLTKCIESKDEEIPRYVNVSFSTNWILH